MAWTTWMPPAGRTASKAAGVYYADYADEARWALTEAAVVDPVTEVASVDIEYVPRFRTRPSAYGGRGDAERWAQLPHGQVRAVVHRDHQDPLGKRQRQAARSGYGTPPLVRLAPLPHEHRLMRQPDGDDRPVSVLKAEWLAELARHRPVAVVVDDDARVVSELLGAGRFPPARRSGTAGPYLTRGE